MIASTLLSFLFPLGSLSLFTILNSLDAACGPEVRPALVSRVKPGELLLLLVSPWPKEVRKFYFTF